MSHSTLVNDALTANGSAPTVAQRGNHRCTILVVDDRPINRDFLVSLLKHFNYELREAESGEQAWGIAAGGGIDLIITDVFMSGMDGFTLLEKLAADLSTAHIPAIVYTAAHKHPNLERLMHARQLHAVLTKPSAPEVIVEAVQAALKATSGPVTPSAETLRESRAYRTTALIETMQDLAGQSDTAKLLHMFGMSAKDLLSANESLVYILASEEGKTAQTYCSCPCGDQVSETLDSSRLGDTLTRILRGHAVGRFRNANPREYGIPFGDGKVSSLLCVPIFTLAHDYGCLCLVGKTGSADFSDEDERLSTTLTAHLGVLLENALSYEKIEKLAARLGYEVEEREHAQEELERARTEQIRLKDQFLSHVSHELRSPVMVVQQFLEILQEGEAGAVSARQRECVDIALRNVHHLNTMIGDLLEATRIEAGKLRVEPAVMGLSEVLKEAVDSAQPLARQKRITLTLDHAPDLPPVVADRSRVRQIVVNLLDNAIKFTSDRGEVRVRALLDTETPQFARITVSDTGCGLEPDEMSRVFERHYQVPNSICAARKGLGLGLCICKELVVLQGGQISVQSRPGHGSDFSFLLPVFSVENLITPILAQNTPYEAVAIISLELETGDDEGAAEQVRSLGKTIERCVLPDLDVMLPGNYRTRNGRMFVIVARTGENGAAIMTQRIEEQLKQSGLFADSSQGPFSRVVLVEVAGLFQKGDKSDPVPAVVMRVNDAVQTLVGSRS